MADWRSCTQEFVLEFIEIYKLQECLWKVKSREYTDKYKRKRSYEVLEEKLKEVFCDADKKLVCKKVDSLRGNFRRELKKIKASQRSGCSADDIYVPRLWYYKHLEFLCDQEMPRKNISTLDEVDDGAEDTTVG